MVFFSATYEEAKAVAEVSEIENSSDILLDGLKEGEEAAYLSIFRTHRNRLYRVAFSFFGDSDAAHDCVQEAFMDLYSHRSQLRRETIGGFLYKAVTNRCLMRLRSDKRRAQYEAGEAEAKELEEPAPEEERSAKELGEALFKTLQELPPKEKACTLLFLESNLPHSEIAKSIGISYAACRLYVHRGMSKLKKAAEQFDSENNLTGDKSYEKKNRR